MGVYLRLCHPHALAALALDPSHSSLQVHGDVNPGLTQDPEGYFLERNTLVSSEFYPSGPGHRQFRQHHC